MEGWGSSFCFNVQGGGRLNVLGRELNCSTFGGEWIWGLGGRRFLDRSLSLSTLSGG